MARAPKTWHPATKRAIDALQPRQPQLGQATASAIYDVYFAPPAPRGFHVRVYPNGRKVFCLRYRDPDGGTPARYRRFDLGEFGKELTVDQAMAAATSARKRLGSGEKPHHDKSDRAKIPTVGQLVKDFVAEARRTLKEGTADEYERMLDKEIVPRFGRELVTALTPRDLQRLHAEITDAGHPTNANRAVAYCSTMLTFAMRRGDVTLNVAAAVKRTPESGRDVEPLTDKQEAALGKALDDAEEAGEAWQAVELVRFLFLSGCRRSEGENLQWAEVDEERRQLVFLDSKGTKKGKRRTDRRYTGEHVFALLTRVRARLKRAGIVSPYVFPRDDDPSLSYGNLDRAWHRIREAAGLSSMRLHDLRHNVASDYGMHHPAGIARKVMGHASLSTTNRYMHETDGPMTRAADAITADRAKRLANRDALPEEQPITPIAAGKKRQAKR